MPAQSCPTHCNPMDYTALQPPLSAEFSRQEYWSGLPFPTLGALPNPGIEPTPPAFSGRFFYHCITWQVCIYFVSTPKLRTTVWKPMLPAWKTMFQPSKERNYPQALVAQMVKNLPVRQETWVRSLGREDPLEKGMANHSSILA